MDLLDTYRGFRNGDQGVLQRQGPGSDNSIVLALCTTATDSLLPGSEIDACVNINKGKSQGTRESPCPLCDAYYVQKERDFHYRQTGLQMTNSVEPVSRKNQHSLSTCAGDSKQKAALMAGAGRYTVSSVTPKNPPRFSRTWRGGGASLHRPVRAWDVCWSN